MDKFSEKLLNWYKINKRQLPWRNSNNPYYVWISEIILQQTKVSTGLKYFNTFVSKYPTIFDLSKSTEEEVLLIWQGLGYYSRAINILKTAKVVTNKYDGIFPNVYNDLIKLPGIGDYTASAILSICFNKPYPVIDGNVYRVLSRYFDVNQPINKHASKKIFHDLAKSTLDLKNPGDYNEALMEFGALNCKPLNPLCHTCVLNEKCLSFKKNIVSLRPVKVQKKQKKVRFFNYLVPFDLENNTIIIKREDNDIWKGLYEFPLIETSK
ncbi:MAG: A/G-specific adenine glycosylase, partial [Bacteroidota bacterium]|nr:A/G-specific adenine glycosylase [Bacteroidota bacterium]